MAEETLPRPTSARQRALAWAERVQPWRLVQAGAFVAAIAFAYQAGQPLDEYREATYQNFDQAAPWLGLALLSTLLIAWQPALPRADPRTLVASLADFWRAHRVELFLFGAIVAFGVFMRVYRFGDTLPPPNGLCCEEHINGGVAYRALHGERPILFPLVRWSSAGGFLLFGENTLGLRFFFVAMGIATLVPFYLLLRQLVSVPAALFGLALFAAAWWPSLHGRQTAEGTIYAVLLAFLLVRGLKTKSPLAFFFLGIVSALISYEYEAYKQVPMIAAGFVAAAAAREVFLRRPWGLSAAGGRARRLLQVSWRPALVFLMAAGITLIPMIVGTRNGLDLYLTSLHRQEQDRAGDLFVDEWRQQAKWAAQIFLPIGPNEYRTQPPLDMPGIPLLDPVAAWLALAGLAAATLMFFRPYRLLFAAWPLVTLAIGAVLLQNFGAWKFIGLVPVALALAALFVDDVRSLVGRVFGERGRHVLAGALCLAAAFSWWWNADTLYQDVAASPALQQVYAGEPSQFYTYCDYLQERGKDNHSYAFSAALPILGFARPHETFQEQNGTWGDFIWICHDLDGTALPAAEEAWPLRDTPSGRTTLVFLGATEPETLVDQLNRAYPGLGEPHRVIIGPGNGYTIIGFEFESGRELARRGLWAEYMRPGEEEPAASRADPVDDLTWQQAGLPIPPPFTVRWRGLAYLEQGGTLSLRAITDEPVELRLDGQPVYSAGAGQTLEHFIDLVPGWHPLEVELSKESLEGGIRLEWAAVDGGSAPLAPADLFPLAELDGWLRRQTLALPESPVTIVRQRLDFAPHYVSAGVARLTAAQPGGPLPVVTEERWRGFWHVEEAGSYVLTVEFRAGTVTLLLDGSPAASSSTPPGAPAQLQAQVTLGAGAHTVEIVQQLDTDVVWSGARISSERLLPGEPAAGAPQTASEPMRVTPY